MINLKLIYITWPDKKSVQQAAKILVEEKLVACANILGPMKSFFIWENKLDKSNEFVMLAKTKASLETKVIERIKELHPYEIPCIISFEINGGNPDFLNWIREI